MFTQKVTPNPNIWCRPGWCLEYVRKTFGQPVVYGSATEAWNKSQYKHRPDAKGNRNFPSGVAVPVHYGLSQVPEGHIVLRMPDGSCYSTSDNSNTPHHHPSLQHLEDYYEYYGMRLAYRGWTEDVQGMRVITPVVISQQGSVKLPIKKEDEVPDYVRLSTPHNHRRLAKDKTWTVVDATNKANQNFAVLGLGHYDIDLFLSGTDLPTGESIIVQFWIKPVNGNASGYFKHEILGTKDGKWQGQARFKMPVLKAARVEVAITSSVESAYIDDYAADIFGWKA